MYRNMKESYASITDAESAETEFEGRAVGELLTFVTTYSPIQSQYLHNLDQELCPILTSLMAIFITMLFSDENILLPANAYDDRHSV